MLSYCTQPNLQPPIKTTEEALKANRRHLNIKCSSVSEDKVLVIGGGSGTLGAIEGLRGGGYTGKITVISKEGYQPIDRTKLSKALLADISKLAWRQKDFYKDGSIDIVEDEAKSIDFSGKILKISEPLVSYQEGMLWH